MNLKDWFENLERRGRMVQIWFSREGSDGVITLWLRSEPDGDEYTCVMADTLKSIEIIKMEETE